jgi:hypothetical protein
MKRQAVVIVCKLCPKVIGTVQEVEDPKRVGFYANESFPNPMPQYCPTCNSVLERA